MEYKDLVQAMSECNQEEVVGLISRYIQKGAGVKDLLDALTEGLKELGEKFSRGEAFIPELVFGGEIFHEAMKAMGPQMSKEVAPR